MKFIDGVVSSRILYDFEDVDSKEERRAGARTLKDTHISFLQDVVKCEQCPSIAVQKWCISTWMPLPLRIIASILAVDEAYLHLISFQRSGHLQEVPWDWLQVKQQHAGSKIY